MVGAGMLPAAPRMLSLPGAESRAHLLLQKQGCKRSLQILINNHLRESMENLKLCHRERDQGPGMREAGRVRMLMRILS